jgi:diguanylate cyclase (GGDEF)-like protein
VWASGRRAVIGVSALLLVVLTIVSAAWGSQRLHSAILGTQTAAAADDVLQDARFFASQQTAARDGYLLNGELASRAAYVKSTADLTGALAQAATFAAQAGNGERARDLSAIKHLQGLQALYQPLVQREFALLDAGRDPQAAQLERTSIAPLMDKFIVELSALEEARHTTAAALLRAAHAEGRRLQVGTPVLLCVALLLLVGFAVVSRRYGKTVQRQAFNDALTGLPNRRLFADRVAQAIAAARRGPARPVVMLLDVDRFKEVNDTLGHHRGDELLVELAARLGIAIRPGDTVARLGGDEFAVLLPDGGLDAGIAVAERILATVAEPFTLAGVPVGVEASVGIAAAEVLLAVDAPSGEDGRVDVHMPDLLQQADTAMYAAKRDRCGYTAYTSAIARSTPSHLTLLGELRRAFDNDELVVHFQPKIALGTGELLGVEALVRWQHPTRGLLGPGDFIALAEGTTLIHRLTTIVLDKALALSRYWQDRGVRLPVAVNVSARTLLDVHFPETVAERLAAAGVPAPNLCLELTESTIMSDPDRALDTLRQLHTMGVRLSVDDFGTGYSSMVHGIPEGPARRRTQDRRFVRAQHDHRRQRQGARAQRRRARPQPRHVRRRRGGRGPGHTHRTHRARRRRRTGLPPRTANASAPARYMDR